MLKTLLKFVRRKAISDCQDVLRNNSGYDISYILAKMSDLKLIAPDAETTQQIATYQKALDKP